MPPEAGVRKVKVGATGRLLNFSWGALRAGTKVCAGGWMTESLAQMDLPLGIVRGQVLESWLDSDAVNAWIK